MSKLYLTSVAILCLLLTACEQPPFETNGYDQSVQLRSANPISISYTDDEGINNSLSCTLADISYQNDQYADIFVSYEDGTTQQVTGDNISLSVSSTLILSVTTDNGDVYSVPELDITVENSVLDYNNSAQNVVGSALDFIIEDMPDGM